MGRKSVVALRRVGMRVVRWMCSVGLQDGVRGKGLRDWD